MMFGLIMLVMTVLTVAALTRPLLRRDRTSATPDNRRDMAIYRAQLAEVDNDIARGLLTETQACDTRSEIQRRMLTAGAVQEAAPAIKPRARKVCATLIMIFLPLLAVFTYAMLGAPGLPGQPYAARLKNPRFLLATAAQRLSQKLQTTPTAAGYKHFADILYLLQDYADSANAYHKAIGLYGPHAGVEAAALWSKMAAMIVLANGGAVVPEAQEDFYQTLQRDNKEPSALFYMGLAEAQQGHFKRAVAIWKKLQSETPAGALWATMLKNRIAAAGKAGKFDPAMIRPAAPAKPPVHGRFSPLTAQGGEMPGWAKDPSARADMINAMVATLAAQMKNNPHDVPGWVRLIRSYRVLGEPDKDKEALAAALRLNPDNPELKALVAKQ